VPNEWDKSFSQKRVAELARREVMFENIVAACAGKCAMDRWHNWKSRDESNWRSSSDFRQAFSYAMEINGGDSEGAELLVSWLLRRTEIIVERQWPRIQRLAAALCDVGKIDGSEITHIVQDREQPHRFV
jgi:hypothetical protein